MSVAGEKLKAQLAQLTSADRAQLAHFLILSLESDADADADAEQLWEEELLRREQEIRDGTAPGEPWAKVSGELRKKYS
ncbi:MAG TPA: addiction module protein [Verrucomicrobiae bacterium]|nr:addiction module protein [Verrucomicrobiae bacterium]